jgi:hypothetical protein
VENEYVETERRCLREIKARRDARMQEDPSLSPERALGLALQEMPLTYKSFTEARAVLAKLGVPPLMLKDV